MLVPPLNIMPVQPVLLWSRWSQRVAVPGSLACSVRHCRSFPSGCVPPPGIAAPAGLPVALNTCGAAGLVQDGRAAAVPALSEFFGFLPAFLGKAPVVLPSLRGLAPGLFVLPAVLSCAVSFG